MVVKKEKEKLIKKKGFLKEYCFNKEVSKAITFSYKDGYIFLVRRVFPESLEDEKKEEKLFRDEVNNCLENLCG